MPKGIATKIALGLLAVGGTVVVIALAPGIGAALKMLDPNPRKAMDKLERTFRRLAKDGDVEVVPGKTKRYILTTGGQRKLARLQFADFQLKATKKDWDGKWRLVCFDIPETEQYVRKLFQAKLSELGFYRLQNSVFVYPYECKEFLVLANHAFELQKYVRFVLAEKIDNESKLLNFFRIKQ